ncbi:MAG TPA: TFIIB-type zinc ribbon-containing protein, partial [Myxococcota bacterium]|nr:TFIIB-type zinc ribbon-containing protein [Myxococcota bacterium]
MNAGQKPAPGGGREELEQRLEVELECPECGAHFVAGVWDHSFRCSYCGSVLACARALGEEVFAASDGKATAADVIALLVRNETESYRNELLGRLRGEDGAPALQLPALTEAQVAAFRAKLERELSLVFAGDFLVPYELHERTLFQGILGRRGGVKESLVQSTRSEDVLRRYDPAAYNLRDRGLKLRGSRLALLRDAHLALCQGRALAASARPEP